jgi:hypothetical protein
MKSETFTELTECNETCIAKMPPSRREIMMDHQITMARHRKDLMSIQNAQGHLRLLEKQNRQKIKSFCLQIANDPNMDSGEVVSRAEAYAAFLEEPVEAV